VIRALVLTLLTAMGCARPPAPPAAAADPVPADGSARTVRSIEEHRFLQYGVATHIDAPPDQVWAVLVDATRYPEWNSTIVSLDGDIAADGRIRLVSTLDPKRTFKLQISTFEPPSSLVWEDGNAMFRGVRTFTLTPEDSGTRFEMKEAMTGTMLKMIAPKLPDFAPSFEAFARDLKAEVEKG